MVSEANISVREIIAERLESNEYLTNLYSKLLRVYAQRLVFRHEVMLEPTEVTDLISFADLLAKTSLQGYKEMYKELAQEIMVMLREIDNENPLIKKALGNVLASTSNFIGLSLIDSQFLYNSLVEDISIVLDKEFLKIPGKKNQYFLPDQKRIFDNLSNDVLSFSGPTSLGKTFLFINFVRKQMLDGLRRDYYIILPTRALVNEVRSELITQLGDLLQDKAYRVLTGPSDPVGSNIICAMTPERFLTFLEQGDCRRPDYVFIDEAQIISSHKERSLLYYRIVDRLMRMEKSCNLIFSSPNIPNPEIYNRLIPKSAWEHITLTDDGQESFLSAEYTPVVHYFFFLDLQDQMFYILNRRTHTFSRFARFKKPIKNPLEAIYNLGNKKKNIVYCKSIQQTMSWAVEYAKMKGQGLSSEEKEKLLDASKRVESLIHKDCFLSETLKSGVAYHIGYLPSSARKLIEKLFREGVIDTVFCTSTVIEGVNFPADNLFITSTKNGRTNLSPSDFKNLVGRAGRIRYQLHGNVFFIRTQDEDDMEKVRKLCFQRVPRQTLSIEQKENDKKIKETIADLANNDISLQGNASHQFERLYSTILTRDLALGYEDSAIVVNAKEHSTPEEIEKVRRNFPKALTYDEYYISNDQVTSLDEYIRQGGKYPKHPRAGVQRDVYKEVESFMFDLKRIFKWNIYNKKLGSGDSYKWFSYLLFKWITGTSIPEIISNQIGRYERREVTQLFTTSYQSSDGSRLVYDGSPLHKNLIINSVLEDIDKILLHELGDYFRIFTRRYKALISTSREDLFDNDWALFIEYGSSDWRTIKLLEIGFSRHVAKKIFELKDEIEVRFTEDGTVMIERSIFDCSDQEVVDEAKEVRQNHWEHFYWLDPEDGECVVMAWTREELEAEEDMYDE